MKDSVVIFQPCSSVSMLYGSIGRLMGPIHIRQQDIYAKISINEQILGLSAMTAGAGSAIILPAPFRCIRKYRLYAFHTATYHSYDSYE